MSNLLYFLLIVVLVSGCNFREPKSYQCMEQCTMGFNATPETNESYYVDTFLYSKNIPVACLCNSNLDIENNPMER